MIFDFFKKFFKKKKLSAKELDDEYWKDHNAMPGREVEVVSRWGEVRYGKTESKDTDTTIYVHFRRPLILGYPMMGRKSTAEVFSKETGQRKIWGQGMDFDVDDWQIKKIKE